MVLRFEEYNDKLSIESKILKNSFYPRLRTNSINLNKNQVKQKSARNSSFSLKNQEINEISKTFTYSTLLNNNNNIENIEDFFDEGKNEVEEEINMDLKIDSNIEIEPFYIESDVNLKFLQEKLAEYETKNDKISNTMKTYILNNINEINNANNEIFSNSVKIRRLKEYKVLNKNNYENLSDKIQNNYKLIII